MTNPFETLDARLTTIETLLLDIRSNQVADINPALPGEAEILNVKQASELLNLAPPTIYSLTSSRSIPHFKRGKKLYFKRSELTAWIESGKRKTTAELSTMKK